MSDPDYLDFRDSIIVACADEMDTIPPGGIEIADLADKHSISYLDTWLLYCGPDIEELGFGHAFRGKRSRRLKLGAKGLARAAEIRRERHPSSRLGRMSELNWGAIGAIGALLAIPTMIILWWLS